MTQVHQHIEASISAAASKATGAGSAVTVLGFITSSNIGMWLGVLVGFSGLVVNWYFKRKADKRAEEAHQAYMRKLHGGESDPPQEADE